MLITRDNKFREVSVTTPKLSTFWTGASRHVQSLHIRPPRHGLFWPCLLRFRIATPTHRFHNQLLTQLFNYFMFFPYLSTSNFPTIKYTNKYQHFLLHKLNSFAISCIFEIIPIAFKTGILLAIIIIYTRNLYRLVCVQ